MVRLSTLRTHATAQRLYTLGLALLLVLSEVFSSNIQQALPGFSHFCRLLLTGGAVVVLLGKILFCTHYTGPLQWGVVAVVLGYTGFAALYGGDHWFFLFALLALGAKDVDLRAALKVYLAVAVAGLVLVQLLHFLTPLVPYRFYCRNWDFGYGHYNGYGARLIGVFFGWAWLRWPRLRWFDWLGLGALTLYTALVPGSRGALGGMLILLALFAAQRLLPRLLEGRLWKAGLLAFWPVITAASLLCGYRYNPAQPLATPILFKLNALLSGRFEIWHNVFWQAPASLLGGLPTDGDDQHAIDNVFLALPMNKGVLGAVVVAVVFLLLLWRLCKNGHTCETMCMAALLCYCVMENKLFLPAANPFFLLLPCVFFWPGDGKLPVLAPKPAPARH
ncbi:MAG: hypothetical protein PHO10_11720 [Gemmiger sp.]|nr:hypothetical protein [Gemmiger sp.]